MSMTSSTGLSVQVITAPNPNIKNQPKKITTKAVIFLHQVDLLSDACLGACTTADGDFVAIECDVGGA